MTLRVALVGTGKVAEENYLPYIVRHEDVELSYYNRSRDKAEAVAARFGGRVAASVADLMDGEPHTVLVLTRESDRLGAAQALLPFKPRRLFFEKPLVAQRGQADVVEDDFFQGRQLLHSAHGAGCETAMVFNYRFFDQTQRAREIVTTQDFGQPLHFTGLVHYACWSHCIDLVLFFMGPAHTVTALATQKTRPCMGAGDVRDVTLSAHMANDATGTLIGTCGIDFKLPLYELTFAYEHGRIRMRDLDGEMEVIDYRNGRHEVYSLPWDRSRWDQYRASFGKAIDAYLDSVRNGGPPPVPGMAGLRELQFEAGIKRSIAAGAPVVLESEFSLNELAS